MSEAAPPEDIGPVRVHVHSTAKDRQEPRLPSLVRSGMVGLMFSVVPVLMTNYLLTREDPSVDPRAFLAAVPVILTSLWLLRPRDRWYAVGRQGFAIGEKHFGQVRWESVLYTDVDAVKVVLRRVSDGQTYRFTGYRYTFEQGRRRVVLEGEVQEPEPRGTKIHLPADSELPEEHELRAARNARAEWSKATGRKAEITAG